MTVLAVSFSFLVIGHYGLNSTSLTYGTRNLYFALSSLSSIIFFPCVYVLLMLYDIDARNLLRTKVLHYFILAGSVSTFIYTLNYDAWGILLVLYFIFAALINLIIITLLRFLVIKNNISVRIEWLSLLLWIITLGVFFAIYGKI